MQPRYSANEAQLLRVCDQKIVIPKHTYVTISCATLMTQPQTWGVDSLEWNPARWVQGSKCGSEHHIVPQNGTFIPWAHGPRICQGKKFSQVEFVAAIAYMLGEYRVEVAVRGHETREQARKRFKSVLEASYFNMTPKIRWPQSAGVVWVRR